MTMNDGVPVVLWDGRAPGSESWTHAEQVGVSLLGDTEIIRNVTVPTVTPYLPAAATDAAVVLCPGGGLHYLATEHVQSIAQRLRSGGIATFVLKYRVVPTPVDENA